MALFKCKMCGGTLEITNETVAVCEYCGTKQTLPKLDDERRANLYDRANHFRRNNEFDKAMGIYEQILNEDNSDAESYWSLVLCRYGIEYVEDPATRKRIPTVNRAQFTSVLADEDYKSALSYADNYQKSIYEAEANAIDEIQKGILAISQKEEPFDVFICYKETDNNGRRTPDSVLANDLYHQLKQEGFKVFFSRITLEDKLGSAYEPYIFAALNSAKVMVVLGTKPEYFNAVWVKNEWSRYLALIRSGADKMLIPAYKDMDPYDLPEEFSHLQAQDMAKLGFMQDLIRGIKKIIGSSVPKAAKETVVVSGGTVNANIAPLLKRAFMFLEDGDWESADEYCEKVLDAEPENAEAYLGKLMAELHVKQRKYLAAKSEPFNHLNNFQKIMRFGNEQLKNEIEGYINRINERNENARLEEIYQTGLTKMRIAKSDQDFLVAAERFRIIPQYKNAAELEKQCKEKAEIARKDQIYNNAMAQSVRESIIAQETAVREFESISGWKDADERIIACKRKIEELKKKAEETRLEQEHQRELERQEEERKRKLNKKIKIVIGAVIVAIFAAAFLNAYVIQPAIEAHQIVSVPKGEFEVGDIIKFGGYEQDNRENGKEIIEWRVLDKKEDKILVISEYVLDGKPYHTTSENVSWEACSVREWLNDEFLNEAFTEEQVASIAQTELLDAKTKDKVFLLTREEAYQYFETNETRKGITTEYANQKGVRVSPATGTCQWWVRKTESSNQPRYFCSINVNGITGYSSTEHIYGIRPAMWISIK